MGHYRHGSSEQVLGISVGGAAPQQLLSNVWYPGHACPQVYGALSSNE
jgi:hypothetical protein